MFHIFNRMLIANRSSVILMPFLWQLYMIRFSFC